MLADALVETFVAPADQREMVERCQFPRDGLIEELALGAKQDHRAGGRRAENTLDRGENRLGLHDHPAAAAIRRVIGGVMLVRRPIADIVGVNLDQLLLNGTLENADLEVRLKYFRKQRKNIKSHSQILDDCMGLGKKFPVMLWIISISIWVPDNLLKS